MGLSLTRVGVGNTTAKIKINVSINLPTSTETVKYNNKNYQYSFNKTNWYNITSNDIVIRGLPVGKKNSITIYCRITYNIDYYKEEDVFDDEGNKIGTEYVYDKSATGTSGWYSSTILVYTHPGPWHWSDHLSKNGIIEQELKFKLVNQWVDHLSKWKRWSIQDDYNAYDIYYNNINKKGYKVYSGDIIYMDWFNNCAQAHPRASTISRENNGDIISVDIFSTLDFNGTDDYS